VWQHKGVAESIAVEFWRVLGMIEKAVE